MKDVKREAWANLKISLLKLVLMLGLGLIAWLIGTSIIVPIAEGLYILRFEFTRVIVWATIFISAIFFIGALFEIRVVADNLGTIIAYALLRIKPGKEKLATVRRVQTLIRAFLYITVVLLVFMFIRPMLVTIHPVLAGLGAVLIAIWALIAVYKALMIALEPFEK